MKPGPITWEELAERNLTGSTFTAKVYGSLIIEELTKIKAVEGAGNRHQIIGVGGKVFANFPLTPKVGPMVDDTSSELLHFAVGMAGEGYITLPCPIDEFIAKGQA